MGSRTLLYIFGFLLAFTTWISTNYPGYMFLIALLLTTTPLASLILFARGIWKDVGPSDVLFVTSYFLFGVVFLLGSINLGTFTILPEHAIPAGLLLFFINGLEAFVEACVRKK